MTRPSLNGNLLLFSDALISRQRILAFNYSTRERFQRALSAGRFPYSADHRGSPIKFSYQGSNFIRSIISERANATVARP